MNDLKTFRFGVSSLICLTLIMGIFSNDLLASQKVTKGFYKYDSNLKIHYGIYEPEKTAKANVLYLHGYGDRFTNHRKLFKKFNEAQARVITFDLPSHGETESSLFGDLNFYSFTKLGKLAGHVYNKFAKDKGLPLFIAGWSTGGLLAIRLAQGIGDLAISKKISGLLLYAPGVSVKLCVGENLCEITNETLTHNRYLYKRDIKPRFPGLRTHFASKLIYNGYKSKKENLPKIPVMTFVAGKKDEYVNSDDIVEWVKDKRIDGNTIQAYQCPDAYHELDNEGLLYGGNQVRSMSGSFIEAVLNKTFPSVRDESPYSPCTEF